MNNPDQSSTRPVPAPIPVLHLVALLAALALIAFLGSGPNADGDMWWQMAYGKYMLENGTLIPDHSIYSWTSASNIKIYCAWVAEITMYLVYEATGLAGLFALRYAFMIAPGFLVWWLARNVYGEHNVMIWLAFMLCYLASFVTGGLLKPEMFSFLLMSFITANYFWLKADPHQGWKQIYLFPLIILIWINTHGGWVIGMAFLTCVGIGEILNFVLKSPLRLTTQQMKHAGYAAIATSIALLITPYGIDYPLQVVRGAISLNESHFASVTAYQSVFDPKMRLLRHPIYLYVMLALTIPLFVFLLYRRVWDITLLLLTGMFLFFYTHYTRMTYFYAIVFLFSFQYLLFLMPRLAATEQRSWKFGVMSVALIGILVTGGYRIKDRFDYPSVNSWFGFGITYLNPVDEAEYILSNLSDKRICNDYDGGGYLIWKLWPNQKVMLDPRYFPYASWYSAWVDFLANRNLPELVGRLNCDVWYLNHKLQHGLTFLNRSPDWKLVFYGRAGAVYARTELAETLPEMHFAPEIADLEEPWRFIAVTNLALNLRRIDHAMMISDMYVEKFKGRKHEAKALRAQAQAKGMNAYYNGDLEKAAELLRFAATQPTAITNRQIITNVHQHLTQRLWTDNKPVEALKMAETTLTYGRNNPISIYNVAMLRWNVFENDASETKPVGNSDWRTLANRFRAEREKNANMITPQMIENVDHLLDGNAEQIKFIPMALNRLPQQKKEDKPDDSSDG
ncbi:MAG: hypothetical protein AAF402_10560 [Pseudomonadota bacterium]